MKERLDRLKSDVKGSIDWCYFPTWKGATPSVNYTSINKFPEFYDLALQQLPVNFKGLIKPHPFIQDDELQSLGDFVHSSDASLINDGAGHKTPKVHASSLAMSSGDMSISQAHSKGPKFVVCDISAAVTECLYLNVPIFLFNPSLKDMPEQKIRDLYPGCYIFKDAEELKRLLVDVVLQNNDTLSAARIDFLTYRFDIEIKKNNAFFLELDRISRTCHR